jgi:predicted transcriptional regulator
MSDLTYVLDRIAGRNLADLGDLARRSKVPYPTVLKVARGYTQNPTSQTIDRLARAVRLERRPRRKKK